MPRKLVIFWANIEGGQFHRPKVRQTVVNAEKIILVLLTYGIVVGMAGFLVNECCFQVLTSCKERRPSVHIFDATRFGDAGFCPMSFFLYLPPRLFNIHSN